MSVSVALRCLNHEDAHPVGPPAVGWRLFEVRVAAICSSSRVECEGSGASSSARAEYQDPVQAPSPTAPSPAAASTAKDPAAARKQIAAGAIVLDVRTAEEFAEDHLPTAANIPVQELGTRMADIEKLVGTDKSRPIVVHCAAGGRAAKAKEQLDAAGYTNVVNGGGLDDLRYPSSAAGERSLHGDTLQRCGPIGGLTCLELLVEVADCVGPRHDRDGIRAHRQRRQPDHVAASAGQNDARLRS